MEHFYKNIYGHFDFEVMYSKMVNESPMDAHFIEVGAFYGKSAAYMAVEIIKRILLIRAIAIYTISAIACVFYI